MEIGEDIRFNILCVGIRTLGKYWVDTNNATSRTLKKIKTKQNHRIDVKLTRRNRLFMRADFSSR